MTAKPFTVYMSEAVRMDAGRSRCPSCNGSLTGATGLTLHEAPEETPMPAAGDLTVCGYCGEILEYKFDLSLGVAPPLGTLKGTSRPQRKLLRELSAKVKANPFPGPRE